MDLTAHRTLAMRETIKRSRDVALTSLLLKLFTDTIRTSSSPGSPVRWAGHIQAANALGNASATITENQRIPT